MSFRNTTGLFFATLALASCGTAATQPSQTAAASAAAEVRHEGVKAQTLAAGQYVVTFGAELPCQRHQLNLAKTEKFNLDTGLPPEVIVAAAGVVDDNLMHNMLCRLTPGLSTGALFLTLAQPTRVEAAAGDLQIVGIDRVLHTEALGAAQLAAPLAAGRYVVDVVGRSECADREANVKQTLRYVGQDLTVVLTTNGYVTDDLIRTLVCRIPASSSASVFVSLPSAATLATAGDDGLTITGVRAVTATEEIVLR